MKTINRELAILTLSAILAALTVMACSGDHAESAADDSTFTILWPAHDWTAQLSRNSAKRLFLLELATPNEQGILEGRLAESWEHSPDYREWTIHLRKDVRWQDGVPVTAHDIKFTVDLWNHPEVLYPDNRIESVEVIDDSTCIVRFKPGSAWHTFWQPGYWEYFYPRHLLEHLDPAGFYQWDFWTEPVGNGPFRYVRHTPTTMVEFEANPDFYLGKPRIDRLVIQFGPESITELLAGNIDALNVENRTSVAAIKDDPRFNIYYEAWDDIGAVEALLYNHDNPLFADARVRRAFAHAINRHELRSLLYQWPELRLVDVPFTETQYWERRFPEWLAYNPALSRSLLEEAGWRDDDDDGVRERDSEAFRFNIIVDDDYRAAAVYVQDKLAEVGIHGRITSLESSVLRDRTKARDFDVALSGIWVMPDETPGLEIVFGEDSLIGYRNPQVIALINDALEATTPERLDKIYQELAPIFQEEQPVTFLTFGTEMYVAHKRVKGLSSPFRANPSWYAGHLWLEDEN